MNKIKSILLTLPVAALLTLGGSTAVVLAHDGDAQAEDVSVNDTAKPGAHEAEESAKSQAQTLLKDLRKAHKEHTAEQRKKNCESSKNGLEHKLTNLGKNA